MKIWGAGLYDNDIAFNVRERFEELLREEGTEKAATAILEKEFADSLHDEHERFLFYTALADTQWNWGRLIKGIHYNALVELLSRDDLKYYESSVDTKERKRVLIMLFSKLCSKQPPTRKVSRSKHFYSKWKTGDTFSLPLKSKEARDCGFEGGELIIRKIAEAVWYPTHIIPVVYCKLIRSENKPITLKEYDMAPYVQIGVARYSERFFPLSFADPEADIARKSQLSFETDEYGLLPVYRCSIIMTKDKEIPQDLRFLGNFYHAAPPEKEYVPFTDLNLSSFHWKDRSGELIESRIIERYEMHNLRKAKLYSTENNGQAIEKDLLNETIAGLAMGRPKNEL